MPHRAAAAVLCAAVAAATAAPSFTTLGVGTQPTSCSADGTVVAGVAGGAVFRWTAAGGITSLPPINTAMGVNVALSADGGVLASTAAAAPGGGGFNDSAAVWTANGTDAWRLLGHAPEPSAAFGISADGSRVVGLAADSPGSLKNAYAAVWRADGSAATVLGSTVPGAYSRANVASRGGGVVAGWQDQPDGARLGCVWHGAGTPQAKQTMLRDSQNRPVGEVLYISADGLVMSGSGAGAGGDEAWVLAPATGGVPEPIGKLPDGGEFDQAEAFAAAADGSAVYGASGFAGNRRAFAWAPARGAADRGGKMQLLGDVLRAAGVAVPDGYNLNSPTACSADGRTVVGWGISADNALEGWVATW